MRLPLPQLRHGRVLADSVAASLREAIIDGYFQPGEKIDQDLVAEQLRVSRTPLREALKILEFEGFILVRPHYGASVAEISRQDIRDSYEVRAVLEAEICKQVAPSMPDSVLDRLKESLDEHRIQLESGDKVDQLQGDLYFHETISKFVENRLFVDTLAGISNLSLRVRSFADKQPGSHLFESLEEHQAILEALRQRDPEAAAEAMRTHLRNSATRIQAFVE